MAVTNLAKSTIGAGVLFLPYALASSGMIPGLFLLIYGAATMTFSLYMISRISIGNAPDFVTIAKGLFGFRGELVTALFSFIFLITPLTAYIKLIGMFADITLAYFWPSLGLSTAVVSIVCAVLFIFPLTLLNNLSKLAFVSVLGMLCVTYICGVVIIDFLVDAIAGTLPARNLELFRFDFGLLSSFSAIILSNVNQPSILPIVCSLQNPTERRKKLLIFSTQSLVFFIYFFVALCGYLHFGSHILDFQQILGGKKDALAYVIGGIMTAISLIFTYPLILFPTRQTLDWLLLTLVQRVAPDMAARIRSRQNVAFIAEGILILFFTTFLALIFPKVTDVLDVFVPIGGSYIAFIFPAVSFFKVRKTIGGLHPFETIMACLCLVTGVAVMLVGTPVALIKLF
jgi:amino acid permease